MILASGVCLSCGTFAARTLYDGPWQRTISASPTRRTRCSSCTASAFPWCGVVACTNRRLICASRSSS
uniref:Putative secreted protein n=1 Tax=Anopheles darlingi TaxID=43151 RepID=A0A2M4DFD4_ANODA